MDITTFLFNRYSKTVLDQANQNNKLSYLTDGEILRIIGKCCQSCSRKYNKKKMSVWYCRNYIFWLFWRRAGGEAAKAMEYKEIPSIQLDSTRSDIPDQLIAVEEINKLKEEWGEVMVLYAGDAISGRDAAERLGITEVAARQRLLKMRIKLGVLVDK